MLLGSEQEAVEIKTELDAEGNFSKLAKNYSTIYLLPHNFLLRFVLKFNNLVTNFIL